MRPGIAEFDAGEVEPQDFDHGEHIRIGWLYLIRYGKSEGADRFREALKRFTRSIGAESRYHETITSFFLDEIGKRLDGSDWTRFKAANADLFDMKSLLRNHYTPDVLDSPAARARYIAPAGDGAAHLKR